jgi:hypothetical protein
MRLEGANGRFLPNKRIHSVTLAQKLRALFASALLAALAGVMHDQQRDATPAQPQQPFLDRRPDVGIVLAQPPSGTCRSPPVVYINSDLRPQFLLSVSRSSRIYRSPRGSMNVIRAAMSP